MGFGINLDIHEHGTNYISTLKTFAGEEDVINHVPRHERDGTIFDEVTKIENMELGVSVWKVTGAQRCLFRHMMAYETPPLLVSIAEDFERRKVVIDNANITQVIIWATPEEEMTEEERDELSLAMQLLCDGVPILKMGTDVVTKEEFYSRLEENEECFSSQSGLHGGRRKRNANVFQPRPRETPRHVVCDWCANGCPALATSNQQLATIRFKRQTCSGRRKRSSGDTEEEMKHLVHLIIGHMDIDCE